MGEQKSFSGTRQINSNKYLAWMQVAYSDGLSDTGQRSWSCSGQSPMACTVEGDFCQCSLQNSKQLLKDSWDPQEKDVHTEVHVVMLKFGFSRYRCLISSTRASITLVLMEAGRSCSGLQELGAKSQLVQKKTFRIRGS